MPTIRSWICLKGLKQDARHWRGLPDRLAEATGGRALMVDLPGAGSRSGTAVPRSVPGMVAAIRDEVLSQRDPSEGPWGLLGLSLGGMVVAQWAASHPEDVAGVVIGNSSAGDLSWPWQRLRLDKLPTVVRAALPMDPVAREAAVVGLTTSRQLTRGARFRIAREHARWQAEAPFGRGALVGQLLAGARFRAPASLAVPALVLVGEADRFVHPSCGHALADRLGAQVASHPTAGHDLSLDAPGWLVSTVSEWATNPE